MMRLLSLAAVLSLAACAPGQSNTEDDMPGSASPPEAGASTGTTAVIPETEANRPQTSPAPGQVPGPAIRLDQADPSPRPGSEDANPAPGDGPSTP